jgi:hypothetical protein
MSDARDMALRSPSAIPDDLRSRLETARLDLLALFRTLDRLNLSAGEIPQRLLQQLFKLDADYAEALWALDQPASSLDRPAMLRDTLAALNQLPPAAAQFRKKLPSLAQPILAQLESSVRKAINPKEAYNMVPGRNPEDV